MHAYPIAGTKGEGAHFDWLCDGGRGQPDPVLPALPLGICGVAIKVLAAYIFSGTDTGATSTILFASL